MSPKYRSSMFFQLTTVFLAVMICSGNRRNSMFVTALLDGVCVQYPWIIGAFVCNRLCCKA